MGFPPVDERIEAYMRQLPGRHDESVLLAMEQLGRDRDFPIIDRLVGEQFDISSNDIDKQDYPEAWH
jgi:predicted O-methyltransferase YrrM